MNAFEAYADATGYRGLPKKQEKAAQGPSQLDLMQEEKGRLQASYKRWQREHAKSMFVAEPRLKNFRRYLKSVGANDGEELLDAVRTSWLPASPVDVRVFALRLLDARCQRIRLLIGEDPLDDPLPPETSVYLEARAVLYPGGRG
jgi:hypothetical protein